MHGMITRRGALAGLLGLLTGGAAAGPRAPLRDTLLIGPGNATLDKAARPVPTTFLYAMELESPATAIRVGLGNVLAEPYTLGGLICAEASEAAPFAPRGAWQRIGFSGQPRPTVPGNPRHETDQTTAPDMLWSDWVPLRTMAARPVLSFRALLPGGMAATMSRQPWPEHSTDELLSLPLRIHVAREAPGDFVSNPDLSPPNDRHSGFVPLMVVEYRSAAPGVQIVVGGDSQLAQWHMFAQQAALALSTPTRPVAVWNVARGGAPTRMFWPTLELAIEQARPSVALIQGWTANDGFGVPLYVHYGDEVRTSVGHVLREGGVPVICRSMPRKLFGTPKLADWLRFNTEYERRFPGALVFDVTGVVQDPARPGDFNPAYSTDGAHPTLAGSTALAAAFRPFLAALL